MKIETQSQLIVTPSPKYVDVILVSLFFFAQPNLYPTVGLQTPGEVVDANFGQKLFMYDIEEVMKVCLLNFDSGTGFKQTLKLDILKCPSQYLGICDKWFLKII